MPKIKLVVHGAKLRWKVTFSRSFFAWFVFIQMDNYTSCRLWLQDLKKFMWDGVGEGGYN
jgi:hypothetical protein